MRGTLSSRDLKGIIPLGTVFLFSFFIISLLMCIFSETNPLCVCVCVEHTSTFKEAYNNKHWIICCFFATSFTVSQWQNKEEKRFSLPPPSPALWPFPLGGSKHVLENLGIGIEARSSRVCRLVVVVECAESLGAIERFLPGPRGSFHLQISKKGPPPARFGRRHLAN